DVRPGRPDRRSESRNLRRMVSLDGEREREAVVRPGAVSGHRLRVRAVGRASGSQGRRPVPPPHQRERRARELRRLGRPPQPRRDGRNGRRQAGLARLRGWEDGRLRAPGAPEPLRLRHRAGGLEALSER
ncbi:MAG: hypothetical protein AVDCRST_MAG87-1805, partial [uncultured Thermomicrobiales bacterium]